MQQFLKEIIKILKIEKIKTINSLTFTPELSLKSGNYSKILPNRDDRIDIKRAVKKLNSLNNFSHSQAVVVRDTKIIGIESEGGTEKLIKKCKNKNFRNKGVLVKFPKKKQDIRIDLPTIGLNTLKQCKSSGLKGIVLKNKKKFFRKK